MEKSVLVLGGGIAGLYAALQLADTGYPVILVTDDPALGGKLIAGAVDSKASCIWQGTLNISALHLGGNLHAAPAVLGSFLLRAINHPRIHIYKQSKLIHADGEVGSFRVRIGDAVTKTLLAEFKVGAIILAPGFDLFDALGQGEFGYGRYRNVITSSEFERQLAVNCLRGGFHRKSDGSHLHNVAFIQCVGSRNTALANEYCSSICCMFTAKEAIMLKEIVPDVGITVFYMDTRACGKNFETFLERAQQLGTQYVRCIPADIKEDPVTENLSIRYIAGGAEQDREFDLVVLAAGLRPAASIHAVAGLLGVALNNYGFVAVNPFRPELTSRDGIFVVGGGQGPLDISETLSIAASAAAMTAGILGEPVSRSGLRTKARDLVQTEKLRIGVFLCRGGLEALGGATAAMEMAKKLEDVVVVAENEFLCTPEHIADMQQLIWKNDVNRVIVGPCILRTNSLLFQEALEATGINRMLIETVDILPGMSDCVSAKEIAAELITQAVARVKTYRPLHWCMERVVPRALIIGGGVSGISAALTLAGQGLASIIVEKERELGGYIRDNAAGLDGSDAFAAYSSLLDQVKQNDKIKILTNSEVIGVKGRQGKFMITLATGSGEQQEEYGAVIIAAGTVEYMPTGYLYGSDARVVNGTKALNSIKTGKFMAEKGGVYAFIQCVGSRCTDRHYCSRTCCLQSVESAIIIQTMDPAAQVYVFYRDIRTPGYLEKRYLEARNAGVIFVQYDAVDPPELDKTSDSLLTLTTIDPMSGRSLLIHPDRVILAVAQAAPSNSRELAKLFHVQVNSDGFLMETHHNFGSIAFPNGGIYITGTAQGPKSMAECLSQSRGIAIRAAKMLKQPFVKLGGCVAEVDSSKCAACLTCVRVCPFGVPVIDHMEKAMGSAHISAAECRGCGVCAAECPNKAIELGHYEVDQLRESIHIALTEAVYER